MEPLEPQAQTTHENPDGTGTVLGDDADAQKLVGTVLAGKYKIQEVLGSGGMSVVYKAVQDSVDRVVALKTLKLELTNDPVILQRFKREILSLSKLNHPNIVTVYDCALSEQNQPFIVMDFVSGQSLEQLLEQEGRLSPEQARRIFIQVCNALEHAHRHGVVHRDIKPGNIMLTDRTVGIDFVKVVDFGLAKLTEDSQKLTQTGHLWGSAPYMSPEQCEANEEVPIDWRSDIYSFGVVMYEVLTGADPFLGETIMDTIWKHLNDDPPKFADVDQTLKLSPMLESIIGKALAKKKEDRFQSMLELREALESAIPETVVPSASRVGMAPARTPTATRMAPATKGRPTKSPFQVKKKQPSKLAGLQHAVYGFVACLLLVLVFAFAWGAFHHQEEKNNALKQSAGAESHETETPVTKPAPTQPEQPLNHVPNTPASQPESHPQPSPVYTTKQHHETAHHTAPKPSASKPSAPTHHAHPSQTHPSTAKKTSGGDPFSALEKLRSNQ